MTDISPQRQSLWRVALSELESFIKAEWQWVVGLAACIAIEQLLVSSNVDSAALLDQLKQAQGDSAQSLAIIDKFLPSFLISTLVDLVTAALATYVFTVLYLQHKLPPADAPAFSRQSFFFWLGKVFRKYLTLSWPMLLAMLVYGVIAAFKPSNVVMNVLTIVLVLGSMVWFYYFYYGLYQLYLVTPLAVLRQEPVLPTSSRLTQDNLWRIWWGSVLVTIVLLGLFFLPFAAASLAAKNFGPTASQAVMALIQGAWRGVIGTAMPLYACVVTRILVQEQKSSSVPTQQ